MIGTGGAISALGDSFVASAENPAGLANGFFRRRFGFLRK
jgi:hypothetical protein